MRVSELRQAPRSAVLELQARHVRDICEGSPFAGQFQPDRAKAYIEFDICHSFPVVAGPASGTGNYVGYHPASLAASHTGLLHQQCNLHHALKAHDPDAIPRDRIVGAVVATHFPPAPEGGWQIPADAADAPCIRVAAVVHKFAEGATKLLNEAKSGKVRWSVSIEVSAAGWEHLGLYVPSRREVVPILEADEALLSAMKIDEKTGSIVLGKVNGEQLALAYGGVGGPMRLEGVGYTPRPAEKTARITAIRLSEGTAQLGEDAVEEDLLRSLVETRWPGSRLERIVREGELRLPGNSFGLQASEEDPCLVIRLSDGKALLRSGNELLALKSHFPRRGADEPVVLGSSAHPAPDESGWKYVQSLRQSWPSLWAQAGWSRDVNLRMWGLARTDGQKSARVQRWLRMRERWAGANRKRTTVGAVLEQMSWGVIGEMGWEAMVAAVEAEKAAKAGV